MFYRRLISSNNLLQVTAVLAIQTAVKSGNNCHQARVMRVYSKVPESYQLHLGCHKLLRFSDISSSPTIFFLSFDLIYKMFFTLNSSES